MEPKDAAPKVRESLRQKIEEAFPEDRLHTAEFKKGNGGQVKLTGKSKKAGKPVTVELENEFCLVIMPRKVALAHDMVDCNNAWDLCIWDPVTGDVRCTSGME